MAESGANALGQYLRARRERLDPAGFGFSLSRRRTPGLRREEIAQRANVSATWYTWLEQGRGGAPSADVLDRIAKAMMLTDAEREHLFLLGLGRAPDTRYHAPDPVTPRLQRVLDALVYLPAYVKTSTWDIVAWNHAASRVLHDYADVPAAQRNMLRFIFSTPHVRAVQTDWPGVARFVVAAFRADVVRAQAMDKARPLIDELCRLNPEFEAIWAENEVRNSYGEVAKTLRHPLGGLITMEYSSFAVDGRPDLDMVVYNPATAADVAKVRELVEAEPATAVRAA